MTAKVLEILSPHEYFRTEVTRAASQLNANLNEQLEFYLVNLLCDFIDPDSLNVNERCDVLDTPLAIILKNALEASPDVQVKLYKRLGDTSLYFAGFFQDYFNRKTFDIGYYISMGQNAYHSLSDIMREKSHDEHFRGVYLSLAKEFVKCVDIMAEIAVKTFDRGSVDLLATYERWTHTQSKRLQKVLMDEGILPIPTHLKIAQ